VEGFDAAPVVRYYGADVATAQRALPERAPVEPEPEPVAEPARPHDARPEPVRLAAPLVTLAVLAGLGAVALATWAFVSAVGAADAPSRPTVVHRADPGLGRALALLAQPSTQRFRVSGSHGRIVLAITPEDNGFLVLRGLGRAPRGQVYKAWVIPPDGRSIRRGASFSGKTTLVPLRGRVSAGAAVAITLEHARSGARGPSRTPRLVAVRP
jgi:hypothetical protein